MRPTSPAIKMKTKPMAMGIQIGARTQTQDQVITLVNFSTMKTMAKSPAKLMPPYEVLELFDILFKIGF